MISLLEMRCYDAKVLLNLSTDSSMGICYNTLPYTRQPSYGAGQSLLYFTLARYIYFQVTLESLLSLLL